MTTQPKPTLATQQQEEPRAGLCFRCEHRARCLETGERPRYECGNVDTQVHGCYMYMHCLPVVVVPAAYDQRPVFGPAMIAGRVHAVRLPSIRRVSDGIAQGDGDVCGEVHAVHGGMVATWRVATDADSDGNA